MSKWTDEENQQRKEIIAKALLDTAEFVQTQIGTLEPGQMVMVQAKLSEALAIIQADVPTEALDLLTCATLLQIVGDMIGDQRMDDDPLTYGLELCKIGASMAGAEINRGGYGRPTTAQHKQLIRAIRKHVEALISSGKTASEAIPDMQTFARRAVGVVLGEPPIPAPLAN